MKTGKIFISIFMLVSTLFIGGNQSVEAITSGKEKTTMANLVILATLKDDPEASKMEMPEVYQDIMDLYDGESDVSFTKYFETVSYGQFSVDNIFPQDQGTYFDVIELPFTREDFANVQQDTMLIDYVLQNIDDSIDPSLLDLNNDGNIDNITVFLQSDPGKTMDEYPTLWPHKSTYFGDATYNGLGVSLINVMSSARSYDRLVEGAGVTIHEFMHSMGYPDLYTLDSTSPVGRFDPMSIADKYISFPLAYMRQHFSGWIDIETITSSTTNVVLDNQYNAGGNQAYIIKSPLNKYEYFVVEYRKKGDSIKSELDAKLGSEGIIVYRVDTTIPNLTNKGENPAIYIFRDQTLDNPEGVSAANLGALSAQNGKTSIGSVDLSKGLTDGALTFQDGSNSGIVISNISNAGGETMSFDVTIPEASAFDLWTDSGFVDNNPDTKSLTSLLDVDNTIYMLEGRNNKLFLHTQNDSSWQTIVEYNAGNDTSVTDSTLFTYENELYASYVEYKDTNNVVIIKYNKTSNNFEKYATIPHAGDQSAYAIDTNSHGIFVTYSTGGMNIEIHLAQIVDGTIKDLGVYSNVAGSPEIEIVDDNIYVFNREANADIKMYQYNGSGFTPITSSNFNSNSYDIISYANKLYLLTTNDGITLHSFDGTTWQQEAYVDTASFAPKLAVSQGNLYLITSTGSSDGNTLGYRFDTTTKTLVQEGYNIDVDSNDYNLIAIGEKLYATYVNTENKITVKHKESSNKLVSISVTPPTTLVYQEGDIVDETGIQVVANYQQSQKELLRVEYTIEGFDTTVTGERLAKVTFAGITREFEYEVVPKQKSLTNIEIKNPANKTEYTVGEVVDFSGLQIQARYSDGSVQDIPTSSLTISPNRALITSDTTVEINYSGKTISYPIIVVEKPSTLTNIEIKNPANKTEYTVGEVVDFSGLQIQARYSDGSVQDIPTSSLTISPNRALITSDTTVEINYSGKTISYPINVKEDTTLVSYKTHVQYDGWQEWKHDGQMAGTSGESKRLEGINIELDESIPYSGGIRYQTHIQNIGWQDWKSDGAMSGTSGQSLRLEAIRIELTGEMAKHYDVYYQVHAQNYGWLDWAKNGELAGTATYGLRLEGIHVQLVKKGEQAPGSTDTPFVQNYTEYQTHVQNVGWQELKNDMEVSGTSGQSLRLEAINLKLTEQPESGSIQYRTHIQDIGWETSWKSNGQNSGTSGQSKRLEAIQIQLTGEMAEQYDIYYRVHAQNQGWLGWAKNGESAGTEGMSLRLEGIQVVVVPKGNKAPGSTVNPFIK